MPDKGVIVIYNTESNGTKVEVRLIDGNLWLTQEQIVSLYNSSKSNISEHIKHILEEGELDENSVVRNFRTTASDGKQYNVRHYNLDMILSVGYRVRLNWLCLWTQKRDWRSRNLSLPSTGFLLRLMRKESCPSLPAAKSITRPRNSPSRGYTNEHKDFLKPIRRFQLP